MRLNAMNPSIEEPQPSEDDLVLVQRMLELSPEQRLLGLIRAAEFFAAAKRV